MEKYVISQWLTRRWGATLKGVLMDMLTVGAGIAEITWDDFGLDGLGELKLRHVSPWDFWPDSAATGIDETMWGCVRTQNVTFNELRRDYPDKWDQVEQGNAARPDRNKESSGVRFRSVGNSGLKPIASGTTLADGAVTPAGGGQFGAEGDAFIKGTGEYDQDLSESTTKYETWLRDYEGFKEIWHVFCHAGNALLSYKTERRIPFARYQFFDDKSFWGIGLSKMLASPQKTLNQIVTQVNHNIRLTGNPIWVQEARAFYRPTKHRAAPGAVITVNDGAFGAVGWKPPPPLQGEMMGMIQLMFSVFERTSGMSAFARGMTPSRKEAVGVVEAMQEASFVMVRDAARAFEANTERLAEVGMNIAAESMIAPRMVPLPDSQSMEEMMTLGPYPFKYEIETEPASLDPETGELIPPVTEKKAMAFRAKFEDGTSLAISKQARMDSAMKFYEATQGLPGPLWLGRQFEIEDISQIIKEASEGKRVIEEAAGQNASAPLSGPAPSPSDSYNVPRE